MKKPFYWSKAKKHLCKDKIMLKLITKYKGHLTTKNNFFYSLSRSIISQQISIKAADSIFSKFEKKCHGKITPKKVSDLTINTLRKCGLTRQKSKGVKSLAKKILNKSFDYKLIRKMTDDEAISYLSNLKQIGRWSSEMALIFYFNRPNIWPEQDIGLLRAISVNYKKKYLPPKKFVGFLRKRFSPYCSVATWYLWRSIDSEPVQY